MENEIKDKVFDSSNLLEVIRQNWKRLLNVAIIAIIASVIVSFILPEKYKATVVLFASQNNNMSRAFLSDQSYDSKDYLAFGEDNNSEQMLQVLKSDELMFALMNKFNLLRHYEIADRRDKWYVFKGIYNDFFSYEITQYESIEVTVYDKKADTAAMMANEAVHLADSLFRQIIKQRAVAAYIIVKNQYDSALAIANKLQDSMNFFRSQGILNWEYQVKELTAGYADAEVKGNAEAVKTISDKLAAFQKYGKGFWVTANQIDENFGWLNEVKKSYMQAKVNAEQNIPSFFVADKAYVADHRTYPIRWLVVAGGLIVSLFFSLLVILILNRMKTVKKK